MKKRRSPKAISKNLSILASFLVVLTIPLAIYGLLNIESFDTRNQASTGDTGYQQLCSITFPYVNPESIEVDKKIQIQITASIPDEVITAVNVIERTGGEIYHKEYEEGVTEVTETFIFESKEVGDLGLLGTITTETSSYPCVIPQAMGGTVSILAANLAPAFTISASEGMKAIKVGDDYSYTLTAEDPEGDTINYAFSFTPRADWLKMSIVDDGGSGKLTLNFSGKPDGPASYMANVFIHDGYNAHLSSQTWTIAVAQDENDIPVITFYEPADDDEYFVGDQVKVSWEVDDLNLITNQELYIATNPGNEDTWSAIDLEMDNKVGTYTVDTTTLTPDNYQLVVRATDNFDPPATGVGASPRIAVGTGLDSDGPDDGVVIKKTQIINISPSNQSNIRNKKATISATLIAADGAIITEDSIKFELNDKDLTEELKLNQISDSEITVIYTPETDYKDGLHKVSLEFSDSLDNTASKEWTFNIEGEEEANDDVFSIFGYEIPKRTVYIIGGGIAIVILALVIPWLLYVAWKGSDDDYTTNYNSTTLPPTSPNGMYSSSYDSYYDYSDKNSTYEPPASVSTTSHDDTQVEGVGYTTPQNEPAVATTDVADTTAYEPTVASAPVEEASTTPVYDYESEPVPEAEVESITQLAKELNETEVATEPAPPVDTPPSAPVEETSSFSAPAPSADAA